VQRRKKKPQKNREMAHLNIVLGKRANCKTQFVLSLYAGACLKKSKSLHFLSTTDSVDEYRRDAAFTF
jgi:hypothetical protein